MARKDARAVRDEAQAAASAGKHKRALEGYLELERLEAGDPQWPKRAGDMLRRLGKEREAVAAYDRAVDRYAQSGFVVQAIAMCRLILQIDPAHSETARRLADMTEQHTGRSRFAGLAGATPAAGLDDDAGARRARSGPTPPSKVAAISSVEVGAPDELELELDAAPPPAMAVTLPTPAPAKPTPPPSVVRIFPAAARPAPPPARLDFDELSLEGDEPAAATPATPAARADADDDVEELSLDLVVDAAAAAVADRPPSPPPVAPPSRPHGRTRPPSAPIPLAQGAALDTVRLGRIASGVLEQKLPDGRFSGITVIPIDEELELIPDEELIAPPPIAPPAPPTESIELDMTSEDFPAVAAPGDEIEELSLDDVAEVDGDAGDAAELASPRAWSSIARRALAETPLFSGLGHDALEALMTRIGLVSLEAGETLFREGDPGLALYIVAEGEVGVSREGPPRRPIARLGPGAFFGEVALVTDQARNATVEAIAPSLLLSIDRTLVSHLVAEHPDVLFVILRFVRDRLLARLMDTSPMFAPMAPADRGALAARFRFLEIEAGAVVVDEGKRADGLYVFLAGRADVRRGATLVRYLGAGDLAGETSVLHATPSPVRIAAVTRCLALCLGGADFREIIMTHPHVLEYVGELADAQRRALDGDATAQAAFGGPGLDMI